jgi:hypothetical protein
MSFAEEEAIRNSADGYWGRYPTGTSAAEITVAMAALSSTAVQLELLKGCAI